MNRYTLAGLSVFGGILCGLAWTDWCPGLILLAAFVPFLFIEDQLFRHRDNFTPNASFLLPLPGFVVFSVMTFGWIRVISLTAALFIILLSALLMSLTFWISHKIKLKTGVLQGYLSLIAFWLTLEFLCLKIPVLSPWINLGNGLSKDILYIQWYEVTGVAGGTLWILLSNILLFNALSGMFIRHGKRYLYPALWFILILAPSFASIVRYKTIKPSDGPLNEVAIIQPNYDPYGDKFVVPFEEQLGEALNMSEQVVNRNTSWLVMPETIVGDPVDEQHFNGNQYIDMLRKFSSENPSVSIVAGIVSYIYSPQFLSADRSGTLKEQDHVNNKVYFNSAIKIDTGPEIEIYHKSKLVPGFELIPERGFINMLSHLLPVLGKINRGYGTQTERICFQNQSKTIKIAPVICYESIFGKYVTDYTRKGANAIFIITNDGWWKNTNGYQNHFNYASLRAIENRRPVIRAANTGISGIIDIRGVPLVKTDWWQKKAINGSFSPENYITPYVRSGDYILVIASLTSILTLLYAFVAQPVLKKKW